MDIRIFKDLENEIFSCRSRGNDYSLFNSDWTLNLKYFTISLYHNYLTVYILLYTYFKLRVNQNALEIHIMLKSIITYFKLRVNQN